MLEMGFVVALGLLVSMAKLSWRKKLWMTSHTLAMDAIVGEEEGVRTSKCS